MDSRARVTGLFACRFMFWSGQTRVSGPPIFVGCLTLLVGQTLPSLVGQTLPSLVGQTLPSLVGQTLLSGRKLTGGA